MPQPSPGTGKRILARVQRLCCLGIGGETLMPDLMREVIGLIPARAGMFRWVGPNLEIRNVYSTFSAAHVQFYLKELYRKRPETELCRPLSELLVLPVASPVLQFWQHTLLVDRRAFLRSDYYDALWRPTECNEVVMLRVREPRQIHGALYLWRAPGEAPFDTGEIKLLESIAGLVAHGMTRAVPGDETFADSDDRALLVTDRTGSVRYASRQAQLLLMMALVPRWSPDAKWPRLDEPIPEIARLCHTLAAVANGEAGQAPPVARLRTCWGEFVLRAYWLGPTDGAEQTREIGVTIERRVPRALALCRRVEDLPLTGREKQLCLLLAREPSRQDFADRMGVAASTAITHQRSVYAKLGVHSRAALLAALQPA